MSQATSEWRSLIRDAKIRLLTIWTLCRFRDEEPRSFLGASIRVILVTMPLGEMWVGSLYLYKAFTADGLIAASGMVEVWRVVEKADWAF